MAYSEAWLQQVLARQDPQTKQRQQALDRKRPKARPTRTPLPAWPDNAALDAWARQQVWIPPTCAHVWVPCGRGWQCHCGLFWAHALRRRGLQPAGV